MGILPKCIHKYISFRKQNKIVRFSHNLSAIIMKILPVEYFSKLLFILTDNYHY